ncbi:hypothetical protein G7B40_013050 [Aetokthonos hydrillicola Thurmond2011]|jgi:hypothetical protein|uniref:Uncharacterized protein n=1 Tax=Aetokthonos hydrillicola Thurmond2011 TaxID=2712845 RepID=A0AAP5MA59_9CYAN|nr:hypothetical protein [Aetokthonos hydrillicola]MBO3459454.1 hypothetical protein [Aetokthonos hydrillicola CCALA 1050]MBW4583817.1 hypothetical protein [Aetokthonos hydrillicola CCALA 1050]MDR9895488.1 hypothetical protein [Aetokthonos hydrillicola Thurmond2011]
MESVKVLDIATEMESVKLPDIVILGEVEGLETLKEIFQYQDLSLLEVYLISNKIGKTVKQVEQENQKLFARLRSEQVYVNDVYYILECNSDKVWVLGKTGLMEAILPSATDQAGIGIFEDIVQYATKSSRTKIVWVVGSEEDWGFASLCKGKYTNIDVRFVPTEMVGIALRLCVADAEKQLVGCGAA